jgi:hypothetical protein
MGMQSFPGASIVVVRYISGAIVSFGASTEAKKNTEAEIQFIQKGDSLIISGRYEDLYPGGKGQINIILPDNATLFVVNSSLYFEGDAGQVSIVTDSISRLSLQSKHLLKAKITTIPNNP